jgi:hypothetical protein
VKKIRKNAKPKFRALSRFEKLIFKRGERESARNNRENARNFYLTSSLSSFLFFALFRDLPFAHFRV